MNKLDKAREWEKTASALIPDEARPLFHLTPRAGWMNDPNGFSYHRGQYHMFYQYNPYDVKWDAMHWGHAVSDDLLRWTYLPCALAPDEEYESFGVYSGSAVTLDDGRQLLLYTGVRREEGRELQQQCVAVGDGVNYEKYAGNPVIASAMLPGGMSAADFRDPSIWREKDGTFRCVAGGRDLNGLGALLLFRSPDGFRWEFESVMLKNDGSLGRMWECPAFIRLDGRDAVIISPQEVLPVKDKYHCGNNTAMLIGRLDEQGHFEAESDQPIDYGTDFYAPQTVLSPDGRRIMIGWLANWDTCGATGYPPRGWFGQMTLPRELSIKNGRLYQQPVRELSLLRSEKLEIKSFALSGEREFEGICGRQLELDIRVRAKSADEPYNRFTLRFAKNDRYHSDITFRPRESTLEIDRTFAGSRTDCVHSRPAHVDTADGEIRLRVIIDRFSAEVFVNDGETVMTSAILTDSAAQGISFIADGEAMLDVTAYRLSDEQKP